jgi:hypothetical protein
VSPVVSWRITPHGWHGGLLRACSGIIGNDALRDHATIPDDAALTATLEVAAHPTVLHPVSLVGR